MGSGAPSISKDLENKFTSFKKKNLEFSLDVLNDVSYKAGKSHFRIGVLCSTRKEKNMDPG